jgi:hypothetical protein
MTDVLLVVRFFLVVPVVSSAMLVGFVFATAIGIVSIAVDVGQARRLLGPVLLMQLFATASGFRIPARRGHYDLLLTSGAGRATIAVVHWAMSAGPGMVSWLALAGVEWICGGRVLLTPHVAATVWLVSTVPWVITVPLARTAGAILVLLGFSFASALRLLPDTPGTLEMPWPAPASITIGLGSLTTVLLWIRVADVPLEPGQ